MSLSNVIREEEVRTTLKMIVKPRARLASPTLRAPPLTKNFGIVGTAFDYLFRFGLQRLNPAAVTRSWIAESGLRVLRDGNVGMGPIDIGDFERSMNRSMQKQDRIFREAARYLQEAKELHQRFVSGARPTDGLLTSILRLAHLDSAFRSRGAYFDVASMRKIDTKDLEDLWRLASLVDPAKFRASTACYLNPHFGGASILVGGADCDVLIDHRLIEVKTIGKPYLPPDAWHQLIGYYLLLRLGGIHRAGSDAIDYTRKVMQIDTVEVYLSRFGHLQSIPLHDLINEKDLKSFARWLIRYLTGRNPYCGRQLSECQTLDALDWLADLKVPRPKRNS